MLYKNLLLKYSKKYFIAYPTKLLLRYKGLEVQNIHVKIPVEQVPLVTSVPE